MANFGLHSFRMRQKYLLICLLSLFFCPQSRAQVYYEGSGWTQFGELTYTALGWSMSNAGDANGVERGEHAARRARDPRRQYGSGRLVRADGRRTCTGVNDLSN